ncbi:hypothetical protein [Cytobacillus praedii]|uniref:hypothetical protein n=1 Tax=Cytobacillus praedii TaxID=1742358 RepID=UPI002E1DFEE0|nr:hypothetical protein [Cytobacillus praedii]
MIKEFLHSIELNDCQNKLYLQKSLTKVQRILIDLIRQSNAALFDVDLLTVHQLDNNSLEIEEIEKEELIRAILAHTYWTYSLEEFRSIKNEESRVVINIEFFSPITNIKSIHLYLNERDLNQLKKELPEKMLPKVRSRSFFRWVRFLVNHQQKGENKSANDPL